MAAYKVPQDVEADDKLLGPFSFRQFIYLIIVAISLGLAWALSRVFIGLVIIPLPFVMFFGALAWPLRKDQPMEIYLAAMLKFFFKPRMRPWKPEGQVNLVTIVAPKAEESTPVSPLTRTEAQERLSYLADVIDTQGWAARGVTDTAMLSLDDTVTAEASTINDVLDESVGIGQQFNSLIEEQDALRYKAAQQQFQQALRQPGGSPVPAVSSSATYSLPPQTSSQPSIPIDDHKAATPSTSPTTPLAQLQNTSDLPSSPDIMRLANNNDLSISAIAREAHRLTDDSEEVVVSLR